MLFNPDPTKQNTEVCFSHKRHNVPHEPLTFNNNKIQSAPAQKHLGLLLDSKLDFNQRIDDKINKCNKIIGTVRRLSMTLSRKSLLTIYKSFARPLLGYADVIYDKPYSKTFKGKLEPVQYNACLAITGAIKTTSRECFYRELGLETLNDCRWPRKLLFFHKIIEVFSPSYFQKNLSFCNVQHYQTRSKSTKVIEQIRTRTRVFENSFFPCCIKEWLKLGDEIRNVESSKQFKKIILDFIKPKENSIYAIHNISGLNSLTRLQLDFSHSNERKFRNNCKDTINPMCSCDFEPETTDQCLLRCKVYIDLRLDLLNGIYTINQSLKHFSEEQLVTVLLFGSWKFYIKCKRKYFKTYN